MPTHLVAHLEFKKMTAKLRTIKSTRLQNEQELKKLAITDTVLDRISFELFRIIEKQGFTQIISFFIQELVEVCNELNLLSSFGRGSAANSIVNYCLDMTKINSIDENLIFERFISPQRKTVT